MPALPDRFVAASPLRWSAAAPLLLWSSLAFAPAGCGVTRDGVNVNPNLDDAGMVVGTDDAGGGPGPGPGPGTPVDYNPRTCDEASSTHSYLGCDYWPTVVANSVWSIFDFAAVVANGQDQSATITVTGPNNFKTSATVGAGQLAKIPLPWVADLKGSDGDSCGSAPPLAQSVSHAKGAYHLVSSIPVTVYQFNALEYAGRGGAQGKNWSSCPGLQICPSYGIAVGCFSFTNDASLLLPSTAMTGNYRIAGPKGRVADPQTGDPGMGPYFAVTGTVDGTKVTVKLAAGAVIIGGGSVPNTAAGGTATFSLNAGDVAEVVGGGNLVDLSGSLLQATQPVQVITGLPCMNNPFDKPACDHVEESVFPAETLGKHYVVTVPTGPHGAPVGHTVRMYGNIAGTHLTYQPAMPGAPQTLQAGQVVDLGVIMKDFEVTADHEFTVASFMLGGSVVDPSAPVSKQEGDPSQSFMVGVEQFRQKYIFLAPDDYDSNWVDVVMPVTVEGARVTMKLDGVAVVTAPSSIGQSVFGVLRLKLGNGLKGVHTLEATAPVGIQVMGYGLYTSYQYPGGLNLGAIAPPPLQ